MNKTKYFMKSMLQLLRPWQWAKQGFVFLPLFFGGQFMQFTLVIQCALAALTFSLIASAVYCFNDIYDAEADRKHPTKCKRPIAAGKISITSAYMMMALCLFIATVVLCGLNQEAYRVGMLMVFYFVMNLAYCLRLKRYVIVDVLVIALGFVLRVLVGGYATGVVLSEWLVMMTFLLALFLAFAKRRDDVILFEKTGVQPRRNTNRYNLDFMNQVMTVLATITIVSYIMYTLSPEVMTRLHSHRIYLTAFFVLVGIIRYLQITIVDKRSGSPTNILLKDRFLQICIIGWICVFFILIYC